MEYCLLMEQGSPDAEGGGQVGRVAGGAAAPSSAHRLRDALEPIATQGWWSPGVRRRLGQLGVDWLEGYAWGRAAALGEPAASIVVATFGVFEPAFLADLYERGRAAASRADVLDARAAGAEEGLATALGERPGIATLADTLLDALVQVPGTARPLFSGLRELPLPATAHGRLWRAAELFREHRGDGHLAACIVAGLEPVEMNVLTEVAVGYPPTEYATTRGYLPEALERAVGALLARGWLDGGTLTEQGWAARNAIEAATDTSQADVVSALGDQIDDLIAIAEPLSAAMVAAGSFPADTRKRAAG
jgi:hypothetical protein